MNRRWRCVWACLLVLAMLPVAGGVGAAPALADNPAAPASPVKLIFVHHSTGENWLGDDNGGLGLALRNANYFVSDTNYGWGPGSIGDATDTGHWWDWFRGASRDTYLAALYAESDQHASYSRLATDPGGANQVILFKSCFPNSAIGGAPGDAPTVGDNPVRGEWCCGEHYTVGNIKGLYNDLLTYFASRQDKLFVLIVTPPLTAASTDATQAANARAVANWLVNDWLDGYAYPNVAVFDFYNVLTSNGGSTAVNDLGSASGNHHRWRDGAVQHTQTVASNTSAYGSSADDSHPTAAGNLKATGEFVPLLNVFYHRWLAVPSAVRFVAPVAWLSGLGVAAGGWTSQNTFPRLTGDVNGDGKDDVVAFGNRAVYVALSNGSRLNAPAAWLSAYGPAAGGWTSFDLFPRWVADVDADGRDDIVAFGNKAVYVSRSTGSGFSAPAPWLIAYGPATGGWSSFDLYPRVLGDVNGDGRADIVAFGGSVVYVSLSTGNGFGAPAVWLSGMGPAAGWSSQNALPRWVADVNGDGKADVIGFGAQAVAVALSTGGAFAAPTPWINAYGPDSGGWTSFELYPRWLGDVNADGRADIVAFGNRAVYVSLSTGAGFAPTQAALSAYGPAAGGWTGYNLYPRLLGDLTGDGRADIVAFGNKATYGSAALP